MLSDEGTGADPGFFLGRGALVSCSTSTLINHIVFSCRIPVVLENRSSSQGGGGAHPLHPPPRSAPEAMLENGEKQHVQLAKKQLCTWSTLFWYFLCCCFAQLHRENFQKLLSYPFYGGNVVHVLIHFFLQSLIFTLHWWPLAFAIFSLLLQNFHVVLPTKEMSPLLFIPHSRSLSPFFSLSFAGLPPTFSFSLSFSCSVFQICGHDN